VLYFVEYSSLSEKPPAPLKPQDFQEVVMNIGSLLPARFRSLALSAAWLAALFVSPAPAQAPASNSIQVQQAAMQKLAFLAGKWSGPLTVFRGPGQPLHLTQTENIQYKLDGLVLLIEGRSVDAEGKTEFEALATVAYDDAAHTYHFRAYNAGRYVDTELTALPNGFSWAYSSGPAHVANTMHLTPKGEWAETTDVAVGANPPFRSVDMLLKRLP
jgi:hypothetical protein